MLIRDTDVFIAGGGPAGLAAGIAAAQRGFSVTVADPARAPIDKACGEGIMPDGVAALGALGVDWSKLDAAPFEGIRFVDAAGEASARFSQGAGVGMRRTVLHSALTAAAESAGVQLAWGTRVETARQGEVVAGGNDSQQVRGVRRWPELAAARDGGAGCGQGVPKALRIPQALQNTSVVAAGGSALGEVRAGVCDSGGRGRSVRGVHHAGSAREV